MQARLLRQSLLALAHLRGNKAFAQLAAGFGISEAAAWRDVNETTNVVADWAPGLREPPPATLFTRGYSK